MKIQQVAGFECEAVTGMVVVIDVLRAFTTAAFAFAAGAKEIILVGGIDEAFALRETMPEALLMGENRGIFITGFDYGNSPAALKEVDLNGRSLIQRTSAGTQGVVNSINADQILCSSFVVAKATARLIQSLNPEQVTFVNTGIRPNAAGYGLEDIACSDYISALLQNQHPDPKPYLAQVVNSRDGIHHINLDEKQQADVQCAIALDRYPFAMRVHKKNDLHILKPVTP